MSCDDTDLAEQIALRSIGHLLPSYCEPYYESEAKCTVFIMKIVFYSYANKTNFHTSSNQRLVKCVRSFHLER